MTAVPVDLIRGLRGAEPSEDKAVWPPQRWVCGGAPLERQGAWGAAGLQKVGGGGVGSPKK